MRIVFTSLFCISNVLYFQCSRPIMSWYIFPIFHDRSCHSSLVQIVNNHWCQMFLFYYAVTTHVRTSFSIFHFCQAQTKKVWPHARAIQHTTYLHMFNIHKHVSFCLSHTILPLMSDPLFLILLNQWRWILFFFQ